MYNYLTDIEKGVYVAGERRLGLNSTYHMYGRKYYNELHSYAQLICITQNCLKYLKSVI